MESNLTISNIYSMGLLVGTLTYKFKEATRIHTTIRKNLTEQDHVLLLLFAQVDMDILLQSKEFLGQLIQSVLYHNLCFYNNDYLRPYIFKIKEYYDLL